MEEEKELAEVVTQTQNNESMNENEKKEEREDYWEQIAKKVEQ